MNLFKYSFPIFLIQSQVYSFDVSSIFSEVLDFASPGQFSFANEVIGGSAVYDFISESLSVIDPTPGIVSWVDSKKEVALDLRHKGACELCKNGVWVA